MLVFSSSITSRPAFTYWNLPGVIGTEAELVGGVLDVAPDGVGVLFELVHAATAIASTRSATELRIGFTSGASYANRETTRGSPSRAKGTGRRPALAGRPRRGRGPGSNAGRLRDPVRRRLRVPGGAGRRNRRVDPARRRSSTARPRGDPRARRAGRERRIAGGDGRRRSPAARSGSRRRAWARGGTHPPGRASRVRPHGLRDRASQGARGDPPDAAGRGRDRGRGTSRTMTW